MATKRIAPNDNPMREIRPAVERFYDLFPPCREAGCYDIGEGYDQLCNHRASEREFEARLAARRQAR